MTRTPNVIAILALASLVAGCATDLDESSTDQDIIGGSPTTGFPEVGMVGVTGPAELCTGFLISPTIVLTAAHCIEGGHAYGFYTGSGTLELVPDPTEAVLDALPNVTKHAVLESAIYPGANLWTSPYLYDVAYVRLAAPLNATPEPLGAPPPRQTVCTAVGYGWIYTSSPMGLLKKTALEEVFAVEPSYIEVLYDTGIAHRGDSGSPLICNGVTVGASSWITDYSSPNAARLYERLDGPVGAWIDGIVNTP